LLFDLSGAERPQPVAIWQCVGMIVGVYGVGYAIAAFHPMRHWPIVLVGLLGKVLGPIGFVDALARGVFPASFGWTIVTNDLVWWVPFTLILFAAFRSHATIVDQPEAAGMPAASESLVTDGGRSLGDLSRDQPVFAVLLRHAGCTFHREAIDDLRKVSSAIEAAGARLVLVKPAAEGDDAPSRGGGLDGTPWVADPALRLYRQLGIPRGTYYQLLGPKVFLRGFAACVLSGHGVGPLDGDGFQLGGLALIDEGRVVWKRAFTSAAERPDYVAAVRQALASRSDAAARQ
jgi:hypothetical protein